MNRIERRTWRVIFVKRITMAFLSIFVASALMMTGFAGIYPTLALAEESVITGAVPAENTEAMTAESTNAPAPSNTETPGIDEYNRLMLEKINAYRVANGLPALEMRSELLDVGNGRVAEIVTSFSHTRPNGKSFKTIYQELGHGNIFRRFGENIFWCNGWDFDTDGDANAYVEFIFQSYVGSPGHNANMLKPHWKYYGGAFLTDRDNCFNIQVFAS
ncbi:MAG: hypothetical protein K5641_05830 [Lachnospiraceae bacterium]|nr:hypothetical protein [Lachnospiraceae bacterium]